MVLSPELVGFPLNPGNQSAQKIGKVARVPGIHGNYEHVESHDANYPEAKHSKVMVDRAKARDVQSKPAADCF
jgi:hypothetical protein